MFVSDKFPTYELDEKVIDREFLRWYFRYPPLWEQARQMSTGSAALSKLTLNPPRLMDLTIPRPTLGEQGRIVGRIEYFASRIGQVTEIRSRSGDERRALAGAFLHALAKRFTRFGRLERVLRSKPRNGWSAKCDNGDGGMPVLAAAWRPVDDPEQHAATRRARRNLRRGTLSLHLP
jgi:type I restriction enzyme S subunit